MLPDRVPPNARRAVFLARMIAFVLTAWAALAAWVETRLVRPFVRRARAFASDEAGAINTQALVHGAIGVAFVVMGAVVGAEVLAALLPDYFTSIADIVGVFTSSTTTTNSTVADALLPVFGIVVALGGVGSIVGLAVGVVFIARASRRNG